MPCHKQQHHASCLALLQVLEAVNTLSKCITGRLLADSGFKRCAILFGNSPKKPVEIYELEIPLHAAGMPAAESSTVFLPMPAQQAATSQTCFCATIHSHVQAQNLDPICKVQTRCQSVSFAPFHKLLWQLQKALHHQARSSKQTGCACSLVLLFVRKTVEHGGSIRQSTGCVLSSLLDRGRIDEALPHAARPLPVWNSC